jgi:hypothetical protein
MIWFYQRDGEQLYYEIRLRQDGPGFELGISYPEGRVRVERFETEDALASRFLELQQSLQLEGWGPLERKSDLQAGRQAGVFRGTRYIC